MRKNDNENCAHVYQIADDQLDYCRKCYCPKPPASLIVAFNDRFGRSVISESSIPQHKARGDYIERYEPVRAGGELGNAKERT